MKLAEGLRAAVAGERFDVQTMQACMADLLSGEADELHIAGFLSVLNQRGETPDEIAGAVLAMRERAVPFLHNAPDAVDTCGTGGDGLQLFNLSTAAAIVAAAAGAKVIKHGNRAASSRSGSADLLESLGLTLNLAPSEARSVFEEVGITFLFAPRYHPALGPLAPIRKRLGIRTLFNLVGPLLHPGGVRRQLLGVADPRLVEVFRQVIETLGAERVLLVHGAGGADELTLEGLPELASVGFAHGGVQPEDWDAHKLGLEPASNAQLRGGEPEHNRGQLQRLLNGEAKTSNEAALRDAVLLNAAAALLVASVADSPADGISRARTALESGAAKQKLEQWVQVTERVVGRVAASGSAPSSKESS